MSLKPTPPLEVAVSNDQRGAFLMHLLDVDPSVPGWADEAVKRALYVSNKHFFLKELIKKGIKPEGACEDFFRVATLNDDTGECNRLLLKAGYRPDNSVLSLLGVNFDKGKLSHAPALIAALPKQMRQSGLAMACARAVLGSLSTQDIDKLDKLWKGKPYAPAITKQLMERIRQNPGREPDAPGEIAERLAGRGWLDVSWLEDKELDSPTGRALRAREDHARLDVSVATAPATRARKRL